MAKSPAARSSAGVLWPLAAVVVVALFLVWLATTSEPRAVPAPIESDTADVAGANGVVVQPADFEGSEASYVGQQIQLENMPVAEVMGQELLLIELPSGAPFLVKLDSSLVAAGAQVQAQSRVTVMGQVLAKTDSVVTAWQESGALNEAHRQQVDNAGSNYIEARRIDPAAGQQPEA